MKRERWGVDRIGVAVAAALAYVPLLLTLPGQVAADTKQYLYLDPSRMLSHAPFMWDAHIGLGTVTHQNIGYLFPMGPYYWLMDRLGIPDWLAQRIWLGTILFLAAMGVRFLLRTLGMRPLPTAIASLAYMLSPYSLDYAARISVILLPWAGLGWMLGLTIRAVRTNRWFEPAIFAMVVQVVGGVNATSLIFAGLAPLCWLLFAGGTGFAPWRRIAMTVFRIGTSSLLMSLWWIAGLSLQGGYGIDILRFTETVQTVSGASFSGEVLRGLGYWFFYGGDKIGPWIEVSDTYTQSLPIIAIGYAVPIAALCAAVLIRWKWRRYFVTLIVLGMAIAVGTHPYDDPAPFGAMLKAFAETSSAGLALRSTGRAVPLVSLGTSVFFGLGVAAVFDRVRSLRFSNTRVVSRLFAIAVVVVLAVGYAPIWSSDYYSKSLLRAESIPSYWKSAIADADQGDRNTRVLEIPGADFASYRWGGLVDPLTPGLMDRPYVARELIPWGSPASADILNAFDRQLQEGVMEPASLAPMAQLLGAGTVLARNDLQVDRFNLVHPVTLLRLLDDAGWVAAATYDGDVGAELTFPLKNERLLDNPEAFANVPAPVARYEVDETPPILDVVSADAPVLLEGDGEGIVAAAAAGFVQPDRMILQAATLVQDAERLRQEAERPDAELVVTDSNRKRARRWSTVRENTGYTERAAEKPLRDDPSDARLDIFPGSETSSQSVTVTSGGTVDATGYGNPISYTPEDRPVLAFDGDIRTAWTVGDFSPVDDSFIRLELDAPVNAQRIELIQPLFGPRDRFITKAAIRLGEYEKIVELTDASRTPDGQVVTLPKAAHGVRLEIKVLETNLGSRVDSGGVSGVGFAEIRLVPETNAPPIVLEERVRVPTRMLEVLDEASADRRLSYVFSRLRTDGFPPREDEERSIRRSFTVPTERSFEIAGVARLHPQSGATDSLLYGLQPEVQASASSSLSGSIQSRPSALLSTSNAEGWQPAFGDPEPWIEFRRNAALPIGDLEVVVATDEFHSIPRQVSATWDGGSAVGAVANTKGDTAVVTIPVPPGTETESVRLTFGGIETNLTREYFSNTDVALPIQIREVTSVGGWLAPASVQPLNPECRSDLIQIDRQPVAVRILGDLSAMSKGARAQIEVCDPVVLPSGEHTLDTALGVDSGLNIDHLLMSSDAAGLPQRLEPYGRISLPPLQEPKGVGASDLGRVSGSVELESSTTDRWVVLRQSINPGWVAEGLVKGAGMQVNGYANGWLVSAGSESGTVKLNWEPQNRVWGGLIISLVTAAVGIVIVLMGWKRRSVGLSEDVIAVPAFAAADPASKRPRDIPVVMRVVILVVISVLVAGIFAGIVTLAVAGACASHKWRDRWIGLLGPCCLGLVAAYVLFQQLRYRTPPQFEWPTRFDRVHLLGWLSVLIPASIIWMSKERDY